MRYLHLSILTLVLVVGPLAHRASAQSIPQSVPYTGSVAVNGVPFNGNGQFKFAIVNETGNTTYWSNDDTSNAGSEPASAVTIAVSNGLYALELGNPDRANMQPILPAVFNASFTFLRVWFSDGVNGFQLLSPDRQLVSVPYAYRADGVSGTGTVVKSITAGGTRLTDNIVLDRSGNIDIQRNGNTITIVGTSGNAAATDLSCLANPCVSPAEIVGPLPDALIPDLGTLSGAVTDVQIPDLGTLSGVLADPQIPSGITRDSELITSFNNHIATNNAHPLSTYTQGTLAEARIDPLIARDSEVPALVGTTVQDAIAAHSGANNAHPLSTYTQGTLAADRVDSAIARVSQLPTWVTLAGIPAGFADGVDDGGIAVESDPQVGAISENRVPKWSSTALVDGQIYDNGTFVGIGTTTQTPSPAALLEVAGPVRVASLAAGYVRVNIDMSAPEGTGTFSAKCPTGTNVLGGGVNPLNESGLRMVGSWPDANDSWSVTVNNPGNGDDLITVYAVCAAIQ